MKKMLLLIDDDKNLLDMNEKILSREGYDVRCSANLTAARCILETIKPDGIIMNVEMPDGSGLDFCRELRGKSRTPVLFLSGNMNDELVALHAGGHDFMREPYDFDVFKARISVMLKRDDEAEGRMSVNEK